MNDQETISKYKDKMDAVMSEHVKQIRIHNCHTCGTPSNKKYTFFRLKFIYAQTVGQLRYMELQKQVYKIMENTQLKFRICYTDQHGGKYLVYDDKRFLIGLDGQVYENYGLDWKTPTWEVPFDCAAPPILQRFTGCHDKNKKEIWEGDKVKYTGKTGDRVGIVEFFATRFHLNWGDQTDDDLAYLMIDRMEVIGNTFENGVI